MYKNQFDKNQACKAFTISVAVIVAINLVFAALNMLIKFTDQDGNYKGIWFWVISTVLQLGLFATALVFSKVTQTEFLTATTLNNKPKLLPFALAVVTAIGLFFLVCPLQIWFLKLLSNIGYTPKSSVPLTGGALNAVLLYVFVAALPAFCEETLFRGVIANGFKQLGLVSACLVTGALFSLYHFSPAQTLHQFVMGCALTLFALKTQSVWTAIAVHFLNNALSLTFSLAYGASGADAFVLKYWYAFLFGGLVVAGVGLWLFLTVTKDVNLNETTTTTTEQPQQMTKLSKQNIAKERENQAKPKTFSDNFLLYCGIAVCIVFWVSNFISNVKG